MPAYFLYTKIQGSVKWSVLLPLAHDMFFDLARWLELWQMRIDVKGSDPTLTGFVCVWYLGFLPGLFTTQ